jgi:ureidoglycolate hydrolase
LNDVLGQTELLTSFDAYGNIVNAEEIKRAIINDGNEELLKEYSKLVDNYDTLLAKRN